MGSICGKEKPAEQPAKKDAAKQPPAAEAKAAKGEKPKTKAAKETELEETKPTKKPKKQPEPEEPEAAPKEKKPKKKPEPEPSKEPEAAPKEKKPKKPAADEDDDEKKPASDDAPRKTLEEATAETGMFWFFFFWATLLIRFWLTNFFTEELTKKHRAEADAHAKLRSEYFEKSKAAHEAGDGAKAKEWSEKAKAEGKLMEEASLRAARAIFKAKNADQPKGCIDLHGLHVKEAEMIVKEELDKAKKAGASELKIIIGAGHHSDAKGPKVGPAIKKMLEADKIEWKNDETNKSGGCIIAML